MRKFLIAAIVAVMAGVAIAPGAAEAKYGPWHEETLNVEIHGYGCNAIGTETAYTQAVPGDKVSITGPEIGQVFPDVNGANIASITEFDPSDPDEIRVSAVGMRPGCEEQVVVIPALFPKNFCDQAKAVPADSCQDKTAMKPKDWTISVPVTVRWREYHAPVPKHTAPSYRECSKLNAYIWLRVHRTSCRTGRRVARTAIPEATKGWSCRTTGGVYPGYPGTRTTCSKERARVQVDYVGE